MASTKRTWLWIIFGAVICIAVAFVALVGGTVYMVSRHIKTELVGKNTAEQQFLQQRERFAGQQPLVELRGDGGDQRPIIHRPPERARKGDLQFIRVLVYDSHDGRLIHVDVPFWLLRLMPPGRVGSFGTNFNFQSNRVRLTVDDLERYGPGLIVDGTDSRNAQVLIWTE
jgi:hypothetical protein